MCRLWVRFGTFFLFLVCSIGLGYTQQIDESIDSNLLAHAHNGDLLAQYRVAKIYEQNLEKYPGNIIHAYKWYIIAAANGHTASKSSKTRLRALLSNEELFDAQKLARLYLTSRKNQRVIFTDSFIGPGGEFSQFFGDTLENSGYNILSASRDVKDRILLIQKATGLNVEDRQIEIVATADVKTAAAKRYAGRRIILYNPSFFAPSGTEDSRKWTALAVLAHELGHLLVDHQPIANTIRGNSLSHTNELQADWIAGRTLASLCATENEAKSVFLKIPQKGATATHPRTEDRIDAIAAGWKSATRQREVCAKYERETMSIYEAYRQRQSTPRSNKNNYSSSQKSRRLVFGGTCSTGIGGCQLIRPFPIGGPCTCFNQLGNFSGVVR